MPDDALGPLADGPLPPLAPAAAVRARGDQRGRRRAFALAGAAALTLVLAAGAANALLGGDERDALQADPQPAATTSSGPTPSTSVATPSPSPTATAPTESRQYAVDDLLLDERDADRAEPGAWVRTRIAEEEGPLLDPCPGGTRYPRDDDRTADAFVELAASREAGGTGVFQQVARYASEEAAMDAWEGYQRAVAGCPTESDDLGGTASHELLGSSVDGPVNLLVFRRASACAEQCVGTYEYYAVQHWRDAVSVLAIGYGEDGDPGADIVDPFAEVIADKLLEVVG